MSDLGKTCGRGAQHRTTMDFLLLAWFGKPLWMWLGFLAVIIALLVFDLGVLHRKDHEIRSEEHTSELQSLMRISYAVFCLKKKKQQQYTKTTKNIKHSKTTA